MARTASVFAMKIAVIGRSIAGSAMLVALEKLSPEHTVTVYEQHEGPLNNQGAGITIMPALLDELKKMQILSDIPTAHIVKRSIVRANAYCGAEKICDQNFAANTLHWQTLYSQLNAQITQANIKTGFRVNSIADLQNEKYDLIIGADGHDSLTARTICEGIKSEYAGYIAWRGTVALENDCQEILGDIHQSTALYFVYPLGHCIMYLIHDPQTNQASINWVQYEKRNKASLQGVLMQSADTQQYKTIPRGALNNTQKEYLASLIKFLPQSAQKIILRTPYPFIQPVYTTFVPQRINAQGNIVLIGDAGATRAPHLGSGAAEGINDALRLTAAIKAEGLIGAKKWAATRELEDKKLYELSERMKQFWVLDPPHWQSMSAENFETLWGKVLAGESWYTATTQHDIVIKKSKL